MPSKSYEQGYAALHDAAIENQVLIDKLLNRLGIAEDNEVADMTAAFLAKPSRWQSFKLGARLLFDRQFNAGYKAAMQDQLDKSYAAIQSAMPQLNAIYYGTDDAELKSIINILTVLSDQADAIFRDRSGL